MGTSIVHYLLDYNLQLRWLTSPQTDQEALLKGIRKKLNRAVSAGIMTDEAATKRIGEVLTGSDPALLGGCDLLIEAIPEEREAKKNLFKTLDGVLPERCIIASNSSSIPPSELIPSQNRSPFVLGMHFFYPVMMKETVELVITPSNTVEVTDQAEAFLEQIGKKPLIQHEPYAFLLNKLWLEIQNEAFLITESGAISIYEMDALVKQKLFSFGVFDFIDSVGIDVMAGAIRNYISGYPHRNYYEPLLHRLEGMLQAGELGQKSGKGFYLYPHDNEVPEITGKFTEIEAHLKNTWLSACRRFTMMSKLPVGDMNEAIREYFGLDKGPFESA